MNTQIISLFTLGLLIFWGCEDSSSGPSESTDFSQLDVCVLEGGSICSTTPKGAVDSTECTAKGGTIATECPAGEDLKCGNLDVPEHDGVKSTAYFYGAEMMTLIENTAKAGSLTDNCEAVSYLLAPPAQ